MNIYGIGRAIVDYYVEGKINRDFMTRAFSQLPDGIKPSFKGRPFHIEGTVFSLVLNTIGSLNDFLLFKETGGTCVNILKTIAQLDRTASCTFSGTVGKKNFSPSTEMNLSCFETDSSYFQPSLSNPEIDEDGVFFKKSLEKTGIISNLKVLEGATGRCLILQKETTDIHKSQGQQGSSYVALASPEVSAIITPEQVIFPENLQYTLVEGMELDKPWFRQKILLAPSSIIIACGTPFGAKNTAIFLKEWNKQNKESNTVTSLNNQQGAANTFSLLVFANDLEARTLEQEGLNFLEWSAKKNILFVITHGCGGSSCYFNGTRLFTPATTVSEELIIDATGAGDVFAGAFITHLHKNFSEKKLTLQKIQATLEQASSAASKIIQVPLCQTEIL